VHLNGNDTPRLGKAGRAEGFQATSRNGTAELNTATQGGASLTVTSMQSNRSRSVPLALAANYLWRRSAVPALFCSLLVEGSTKKSTKQLTCLL
jgi:hypothetical protein